MLHIVPIDLKKANEFVLAHHRHNGKVLVHRFSIAVYDDDRICGVAIVGNPSARKLCDGYTLEIHRCCTDGTRNACSILYGRCAKIAKALGYKKIITYITEYENGASLRAANYVLEADGVGSTQGWNMPSRPRFVEERTLFGDKEKYPICRKKRYVKHLTDGNRQENPRRD